LPDEFGTADLPEDFEMGSGGASESAIGDAVKKDGATNPERIEFAQRLRDIFEDGEVCRRKIL